MKNERGGIIPNDAAPLISSFIRYRAARFRFPVNA